jgi:hypothetical protein
VTELGLPTNEVSLKLSKDSFSLPSVFSVGVNLSTGVIEGLDSGSGPQVFKELPEEVEGVFIPSQICARNFLVRESLPHTIHSKALAEADEVVDQSATSQEGDSMVVIAV